MVNPLYDLQKNHIQEVFLIKIFYNFDVNGSSKINAHLVAGYFLIVEKSTAPS